MLEEPFSVSVEGERTDSTNEKIWSNLSKHQKEQKQGINKINTYRPFRDLFPRIFHLSSKQFAVVSEFLILSNWNLHLSRNLRDLEIVELSALLGLLSTHCPIPSKTDTIRSSPYSNGCFSVSSFFSSLSSPPSLRFHFLPLPFGFLWFPLSSKLPFGK